MPVSLKDFWKLAIDSHLLSLDECKRLNSAFARVPGAQQGNAGTLAQWLLASGVLSRYQASVLLAGKLRPFVFGEYKVHDRLESGRLKGLFRAVHLPTGHGVALYFFSRALVQDARHLSAAVRQAQAAASAREDHLCRVFEFAEAGSAKFVALEDLSGTTLADQLASGRVAPPEACRIVRDLTLAVAALHAAGEAHGDIRPENVWLTADGRVKLLGFPLAREPAEPAAYRVGDAEPAARLVAQADYLAPELAHGRRPPDAGSDVYSLGCLLYELFVGQAPFAGGDVPQKLARHASEAATPLDQLGMPATLSQLAAHMMAKNPPVRLASASQVAVALTPFAAPDPTAAKPQSRTLTAYEQILAQRPAGGTSSSASEAGPTPTAAAPESSPVIGGALLQRAMPDAGVAVAERPAFVVRQPAVGGEARQTGAATAPVRPKRRKVNPMFVAVGVFGVFAIGAIIAGLAMQSPGPATKTPAQGGERVASASSTKSSPTTANKSKKTKKKSKPARPARVPKPKVEGADDEEEDDTEVAVAPQQRRPEKPPVKEVDDDGETLWVSPTSGDPISFRYLPAGAQLFMILRPADMLNNAEGARMIEALGPASQVAKDQIKAITGVDPANIAQLIVGFYPNEMGPPHAAFVVRLAQEMDEEKLLEEWKNPSAAEHGGKKYFKNAQYAFYLPAAEKGRVFCVTAPAEMEETIDSEAPPLRKEMEKLLTDTDDQRHFTLLVAPFSLFTDGRTMFVGELERLQKPLERFLGDGVQAAMLSLHAGSDFFLEMRAYGQAEDDPYQLAARYRTQLAKVPDEIDDYINTLPLLPYGRAVLRRFPDMIRLVENYTRIGEERRQAVLRCYLPGNAGHNLVMGTELTLFERPGAAAAVAVKTGGPKKPATPADALKQKISLSFPRDTLEKCMEMLSKEIDSEVVILGSDLQLDGITKNQSFGLDERDKPAEEILRAVLKLANTDGKLVYVIKPKDGGKDAIFITTRSAAEKRGDKLPPEFAVKDPPKSK